MALCIRVEVLVEGCCPGLYHKIIYIINKASSETIFSMSSMAVQSLSGLCSVTFNGDYVASSPLPWLDWDSAKNC